MKVNITDIRKNASQATRLLKSLANPERLMILCQLVGNEFSVGELWDSSDLSQSAFSQHLAKLRKDKLVKVRKEAQTVYYSIADEKVINIIQALHGIYCK